MNICRDVYACVRACADGMCLSHEGDLCANLTSERSDCLKHVMSPLHALFSESLSLPLLPPAPLH